jgi:hypothetical protein
MKRDERRVKVTNLDWSKDLLVGLLRVSITNSAIITGDGVDAELHQCLERAS